MPGKELRCDHDGCEAVFPTAPIRGTHWLIRAEAEKAGWVSSRAGFYNVDDDSDRDIQDFCPEHADDLDVPVHERIVAQLDAAITDKITSTMATWKSVADDAAPVLTLETLQAAIDEIKAGPRVPVIERRGTTIYIDGVPTYELNMPLLAERARAVINLHIDFVPPPVLPGFHDAVRQEIARQLAESRSRITDVGCF